MADGATLEDLEKYNNGKVTMSTQRLMRSRWAYIPEEYIKCLVQGRVRTIQKGKLEERRHEVRDHEHGQAGVSKRKK